MKSELSIRGFVLILSALIVSGCGATTAEPTAGLANPAAVYCEEQGYTLEIRTDADGGQYGVCIFPDGSECEEWAFYRGECSPASEAAVKTPAAEEPTAAPTATPTEVAVEVPDVVYEGISFSYDDGLAAEVTPETAPAVGPAGPAVAEWEVEPEHIRFSFNGYVLPETFHEPRILVYPVSEFEAASEMAGRIIASVRRSLAERPAVPEAMPIVPPFNAGQLMRAQVAYIDFQNGTGMRFLTQLGQAYAPINNNEIFYAYQGLTGDGNYYVAAVLPVSHPALPADGTEIPGGDWAAFAENFESYASDVEQQLDAQDASSFTPDLSLLDAMIQSLEVVPTTGQGTQDEGWKVYVNDVYGYQFSYPASATVTEIGVEGFPTDELPEGMTPDEYFAQLRETYSDKLCVHIEYGLGYVYISAPPNEGIRYATCGRTGRAYDGVGKSDTIVIDGQSYTAVGYEEIGPGETLAYHNETLVVTLADGTRIEYGAAPDEAATYEDYLETTRDVLLRIVSSYVSDEPMPTPTPS